MKRPNSEATARSASLVCFMGGLLHWSALPEICYQQQTYKYLACYKTTNQSITRLLVEGLGIRSIARVLKISITTVIRRIKGIARLVNKPFAVIRRGIYEIDELWTFIGKKSNETWIAYSLERRGRKVIDFKVGARSIENLKSLTENVLTGDPKKICTDGLGQ